MLFELTFTTIVLVGILPVAFCGFLGLYGHFILADLCGARSAWTLLSSFSCSF